MSAPAKQASGEPMVVAAGDPRYISIPGIVKPIQCGSASVAKRIVRCVNSHDELVAALRDALLQAPAHDPTCGFGLNCYCSCWRSAARAAIAKAEGEA